MALDPSIILGVKPVDQPADPYRQYQVAAQLKDAAQQRQVRDLEIQGIQRQNATDAALNDALSKATVIDPKTGQVNTDRAAALTQLKQGGFGKTALGLQENWQKGDLAKSKDLLDQQGTMLKNQQMHTEAVGQIADAILAAPLENQPVVYAQARASAIQRGIITPDELPDQYNPQNMQVLRDQSQKVTELLAGQAKKVDQDQASIRLAQDAKKNAFDELYKGQELANTRRGQDITMRGQNMVNAREIQRLSIEDKKFQFETGQGQGGDAIVDAIGTGHVNADNLGRILSKNPGLIQAVVTKYPDFDSSKAAAYVSTYKDFTSGKTSQKLNAGGTALGHLSELKTLNTYESRVPGTKDYQKYQSKLETLATELAAFYGDSTIPGIAAIKKTLGATFNRDAAIQTQAQSMGDKLDAFKQQWENAAPSKAYQAPLPGISEKALAARAALAGKTSPSTSGLKVGDTVRLKNGKSVKVSVVHDDGSFQ